MTDKEREQAIARVGVALKAEFPSDNMQLCFNLVRNSNNVNYNMKKSGILYPGKVETGQPLRKEAGK